MRSRFERFSPEWWEWMTMPEPNTGCWLWTGCLCKSGYGRIAASDNGSPVLVHRIAYERAFGPFERSMKVCHRCDTPSCVNPDHLFLGTQLENMRDMFAKGRGKPRGVRQRRTTSVIPPVADAMLPTLALENTNQTVVMVPILHPIRTPASLAGWRRVIGVPAWPAHHDGPSCEWPRLRTPNEPVTARSTGTRPSRQWRRAAVRPVEAR